MNKLNNTVEVKSIDSLRVFVHGIANQTSGPFVTSHNICGSDLYRRCLKYDQCRDIGTIIGSRQTIDLNSRRQST